MKHIKEYKYYIKENIDIFEENWEEEDSIPNEFIGHEDFYNFLVDNNALDKWVRNALKNQMNINNIRLFLNRTSNQNYIFNSFDWYVTPEEYDYWSILNRKWWKLISFHYIKY